MPALARVGCGGFRTEARAVEPFDALASFYDRAMGDAVAPVLARCYDRSLRRYGIRFRSAADVACGTGRYLRHLAGGGRVLYGVDRSAAMLWQAARRLRGMKVTLLRQDMRALALPHPVDLITCQFDTLNYFLSPEVLGVVLRRFRDNLISRGHLLFDLITGGGASDRRVDSTQMVRFPGGRSRWRIAMLGRAGSSAVLHTTLDGSRTILREHHRQRWYPLPQMTAALNSSGFVLLGAHDPHTYRPADHRSFWVHGVARRRD